MTSPTRALRRAALELRRCRRAAAPRRLAQPARLGKSDFPHSTRSREAQEHFLLGVAALHSFWSRRLSTSSAPPRRGSRLRHGLLGRGDGPQPPALGRAGRGGPGAAASKIERHVEVTPRERGSSRPSARSTARAKVARAPGLRRPSMGEAAPRTPDDLGGRELTRSRSSARGGRADRGYSSQMQARARRVAVYDDATRAPGRGHYIINSFDDPEHAVLALPAARRYVTSPRPATTRAHMPSHIFLQPGIVARGRRLERVGGWAVSVRGGAERQGRPMGSARLPQHHWHLRLPATGAASPTPSDARAKQRDMAASNTPARQPRHVDMAGAYLAEGRIGDRAAAFVETFDKAYKSSGAYGWPRREGHLPRGRIGAAARAGRGKPAQPAAKRPPHARRGGRPACRRSTSAARPAHNKTPRRPGRSSPSCARCASLSPRPARKASGSASTSFPSPPCSRRAQARMDEAVA